ncbi:MAG: neutral/alkaline non-lysosomal ceramidase N-terminal domain-containing protein [Planctomycetota bacterium]
MRAAIAFLLSIVAACHGPARIELPAPLPAPAASPTGEFRAGARQVDITPPPGLPSLGYVIAAEHATYDGHQTRLRTQAIVLEDEAGLRIALVTMDLAWSSTILRWKVAERVRESCGISADRILLAGTHSHTGPAGFSSWHMYNDQVYRAGGYDAELVDFLVRRIVSAIEGACAALQPARMLVRHRDLAEFTRNRSAEAHAANEGLTANGLDVDPRLTLIRIVARSGEAIAGFCVFSGHPTTTGPAQNLWHADVFGIAVHEAQRRIAGPHSDFVVALANGSAGDVSFDWQRGGEQSHEMAMIFGQRLAEQIRLLWEESAELGSTVTVDSRLEHHTLPGATVAPNKTPAGEPRMGKPALGGAEDGPTWLSPAFAREGRRRSSPRGEHGAKRHAFGFAQRWFVNLENAPTFAPIQVIRIGDIRMVALPFEMTVESARRLRELVASRLQQLGVETDVLVISTANDYASYCTTNEEYGQQHYEGASTLYGPHVAEFVRERSAAVAVAMERGAPQPAWSKLPLPVGSAAAELHAMPTPIGDKQPWVYRRLVDPQVVDGQASMHWWGLPRQRIQVDSGWLVCVETQGPDGWEPLAIEGEREDDRGLYFEVELIRNREQLSLWQVRWKPGDRVDRNRTYRFVIARRRGAARAASAPFRLSRTGVD